VLDLAAGRKVLRKLALGNGGDRASARNSMARGDVVPWSMARTEDAARPSRLSSETAADAAVIRAAGRSCRSA